MQPQPGWGASSVSEPTSFLVVVGEDLTAYEDSSSADGHRLAMVLPVLVGKLPKEQISMSPKIHIYTAPTNAFYVNSFLIEGDDGVIVVDTQFLVSSAGALRKSFEALAKPLAAVIITHPHPDHYNGLSVFLEGLPVAPIYATRPTIDGIKATHAEKRAAWAPIYGDDYPKVNVLPNRVVDDERLVIAGIELRMLDLGPGESSDVTVIHVPDADALLASDLIYSRCHPWLAESRSNAWLRQIEDIDQRFGQVSRIFPGHGPEGGRELLDEQRRYILEFRKTVSQCRSASNLVDDCIAKTREQTIRGRPDWPLDMLIDTNAKAMLAELSGK